VTETSTTPTQLPANELDVAGEAALYRALRSFWHPVMYATDLGEDRPAKAVLLDQDLVLVRLGGQVRCFRDLCLHRGTALSLGWVEADRLRCAYHGWTYDPEGFAVDIPARPELSGRLKVQLARYPVQERDGLIWVSLVQEPAFPIPEFPEFSDPSYRVVSGPVYEWRCSAPRRLENFVDFGHFAWVHTGILGDRDHPEVPDHDVWREGPELRFFQRVVEPNKGTTKDQLGLDDPLLEVDNTYRLTIPLTIYLNRKFPGDNHYILVMSASPAGAKTTRSFWFIARNYAFDTPDEDFIEFEDQILEQDRPIVESQRPEELPVDLSAELHVRGADKVSLEYRRWLIELARSLGGSS
jgi:phenylpropionate dioxygenase-like ring-hydroxylating dioxygenase large terminal subunit